MTHICVSKLTIIGSDNGLSPDRRQAIIWTNAGLLLIGPLEINVSEILIKILTFSFMKMPLKVSSAKQRPFCLSLSVLMCGMSKSLCCLILSRSHQKGQINKLSFWGINKDLGNRHIFLSDSKGEHILSHKQAFHWTSILFMLKLSFRFYFHINIYSTCYQSINL